MDGWERNDSYVGTAWPTMLVVLKVQPYVREAQKHDSGCAYISKCLHELAYCFQAACLYENSDCMNHTPKHKSRSHVNCVVCKLWTCLD